MNKKECIKKILMYRKNLLPIKELVEQLPDDFPYDMQVWGFALIDIRIIKIEQLQELRKSLREIFGTWKDQLNEIFPFRDGDIRITWRGKVQDIKIDIKYFCTRDTMPKGIQKPGCFFENYVEEEVRYVCEVEE